MYAIAITEGGQEVARCFALTPGGIHDVVGHDVYVVFEHGKVFANPKNGREFTIERMPDREPERSEAMRLFAPAPNQIPGQLSL